ncbi:helix-turn-helix domain-containing protein [Intestinibacter sp.]
MEQEKIGKFIAECRKEKGMTQAQLAEQLGITNRAVSKWENAKCMPDVSVMISLCEILNISVNELLSGEKLSMNEYKEKAEQNMLEIQEKRLCAERNTKIANIALILIGLVILEFTMTVQTPHSITWRIIIGLLGCFALLGGICKTIIKK